MQSHTRRLFYSLLREVIKFHSNFLQLRTFLFVSENGQNYFDKN